MRWGNVSQHEAKKYIGTKPGGRHLISLRKGQQPEVERRCKDGMRSADRCAKRLNGQNGAGNGRMERVDGCSRHMVNWQFREQTLHS
jgi:hypothetical protein